MAHKFNPKDLHKLDNPERRRLLPPEETLEGLGLRRNDIIADIGCGIGYFSFAASKIVGATGKVYAIDTSEEMLKELKKRLNRKSVNNIELIKSEEYKLGIGESSVNFALMSNVLHEISDKTRFVRKIFSALKRNGKLAIIEWEKKAAPYGPPEKHRLADKEVEKLLIEIGLKQIEKKKINSDLYSVIGRKV